MSAVTAFASHWNQAGSSEDHKNPAAKVFHLEQLLALKPGEAAPRERRAALQAQVIRRSSAE